MFSYNNSLYLNILLTEKIIQYIKKLTYIYHTYIVLFFSNFVNIP